MEKTGLTKRQSDIFKFLKDYKSENGYPPTIHEICSRFGFASTNGVHQQLGALEKKGYIERLKKGASRAIIIKDDDNKTATATADHIKDLTIVGEGRSDNPFSIFMAPKGSISIDARHIPADGQVFAAIVKDDGLSGSGISAGDIAIVRQGQNPDDESIVFAIVNDMNLIRRIKYGREGYELRSDTRGYPRINIPKGDSSAIILGSVTGLIKKF